ncbi:MAG: hypothetical protein ACP6IY_21530 [Promethearchaeia archaeon]
MNSAPIIQFNCFLNMFLAELVPFNELVADQLNTISLHNRHIYQPPLSTLWTHRCR